MSEEACLENALAVTAILALKRFDNLTLAAFNNAVQTWGYVAKENMAFQPAVDAYLINTDGLPWDLEALKTASAFEVNRRADAGTFL
jgi:hypothetical protein